MENDISRVMTYQAYSKLENEWIDKNSVSHVFEDGKGTVVLKDDVSCIDYFPKRLRYMDP